MSSFSVFELFSDGNVITLDPQFEDPFLTSYSTFDVDMWQLSFDNPLFKDDTMPPWPDAASTTSTWDETTLSEIDQLFWDPSIAMQTSRIDEVETNHSDSPLRTPSSTSIQTDNSSLFMPIPFISEISDGSKSNTDNNSGSQICRPKRYRRLDRQMRRREQNRASQKRYRASKEAKLHEAHERMQSLELHLEFQIERNIMLERECSRMKAELEGANTLP